ncbi:enolase C-terminal domain-like protein [Paenibacillus humicola]|uniref:enolase C-terminal domain-like protein n=1 Tax=Paenibacillus humicola TaxID=3110540 RepID=UPI00237B594F|nr:enolase C-terminal domain-like protein [Paenibacillus humicola]
MKVTKVNVYVQNESKNIQTGRSWLSETVIANPLSIYPEYGARRSSWRGMDQRVLVRIETDEGVDGLGFSTGGMAAASIIKHHFEQLLMGQNPFQVEKLWDILFKSSLPYGRKGLPIMAISAVDLALWDLIAKARSEPLYQTLGGPVKDKVQAYVTGNEYDKVKGSGYWGQKLAMPYGPHSGQEGIRKNVELVRKARETLGPDMELMLDCYMGWNVDYTIRMAKELEPYRIRWIEESLPPDDYKGYGMINRKISSTAIATGEHEYTRWGFAELLEVRAAEILQPDICWCGGLSEARKISAMASAHHIQVIPHAGGLQPWALHLIFADANIPLAEYIYRADERNDDPVIDGLPAPKNGWFELPEGPGAGIRLSDRAQELITEIH